MAQPKNGVSAQDVKKIARLSRLHVEEDRLQPIHWPKYAAHGQ